MPSICMLLTFAPNSTRLFSLPLTMGRRYGRSMLTMRCFTSKAVYVKKRRKTVADGTHYLAVLDGGGRVNQHATEYLHVDTSVKHLYQAVV